MALPSRYTQLRYIQSSGTQWIDTGFVPTAKTKIEFDFEYTNLTAQYSGLFVSGSWFMYGINGNHEIYLGTQYAIGDTATKDRTLVTIDGVNKVATIGNKSYSFSEASFTKPSVTLPIFVLNDGSAKRNYCYMKLYSYKIYDDGTLIRNFVPALRHDSYGSLAGLYDLVNNVFYTNAGSGSFSYDLATGAVDGVGASIIDAASYGITEGKCMAGGTGYSVKKGRTLVGGTGYDISFGLPPLNECDWATIRAASDAGEAANYWAVGDTKTITINGTVGGTTFNNLSIDVVIIGIDHNSALEGTNRIHFQIGKINGVHVALVDANYGNRGNASRFQMNASNTNRGGWNGSNMRKTLLGNSGTPTSPPSNSLLAALPPDLRAVMKAVTKYSDNTGGGSNTASYVTSTTDYLFLLSNYEYYGTRKYANSAEQNYQAQYDYYKAGNSKIRYKHNAIGTEANVWCRSVDSRGSDAFCIVYTNGAALSYTANYSYGVAPAFCV